MRRATGLTAGLHSGLALAALLTPPTSGRCPHPFQDEQELSAQLSYRPLKKWDVIVPRETWLPVRDAIQLNGFRFAVQVAGRSKLLLDTDGDGQHDARVSGARDFVVLRARGEAGERFVYALRLRTDGQHWEWSAGGAMTGHLAGRRVRVIDQNGNGRYNDFGRDALLIGSGRGASLLSRVVNIAGELHRFEVSADGTRVGLSAYEGPTARIDPHSGFTAKARLTAAVIVDDQVSFNVAEAKKSMLVPAGEYRFVSGFAEGGSESVHMRGGKMASIRLDPGSTVTLEWGGPVWAEFDYRLDGTHITVSPRINFYGRLGEEYYTFKPDANTPMIVIRDSDTGRVVQSGRLGGCCGGGYSAYTGKVPSDTQLEVRLEHARAMFGEISGRARRLAQGVTRTSGR